MCNCDKMLDDNIRITVSQAGMTMSEVLPPDAEPMTAIRHFACLLGLVWTPIQIHMAMRGLLKDYGMGVVEAGTVADDWPYCGYTDGGDTKEVEGD